MNTNALKKFAQEARRKLLEQVGAKLEYVLHTDTPELREKADQVQKLREAIQKTSKEQIIDKVTYTWFNRFIALRFMDANDYQPVGIRVLTPKDGYTLPELLDEAKQGHIPEELSVKKQRIYDLLDGKIPSSNAQNEAYKDLLIGACNHLNKILPFLFERINDYTELLLPDDLTSELSIIQDIRDGMSIQECAEVEIVGWLYQFYISEKNEELISSKKVYKKDELAPASQLFTPKWIVQYMVDNTLGQVWSEINPATKVTADLEFYIKPAYLEQVQKREIKSIEEVKFFEPCTGSGHILAYAFDVFYKIYEEQGYNPTEIPELIITKNLFGVDIDQRASQLASFVLLMKGRQKNRRFLRSVETKNIQPNISYYQDFEFDNKFKNATALGSLIRVDADELKNLVVEKNSLFGERQEEVMKLYQLLGQRYDIVVTNPPYISSSRMEGSLKQYVEVTYPDTKSDLFATFILRCLELCNENGLTGFMTPFVWMFISSYEKLREVIIEKHFINNLIQLEYSGFDGATVPICTFTLRNKNIKDAKGSYVRLSDFKGSQNQAPKTLEAINNKNCVWFYTVKQAAFEKIPGSPIGYWLSEKAINNFKEKKISDYAHSFQGLISGSNDKLMRFWAELPNSSKTTNFNSYEDSVNVSTWVPYQKGGSFKKWYGNNEFYLYWNGVGNHLTRARTENRDYYFKRCLSWTFLSSSKFGVRKVFGGQLWDVAGSSAFPYSENEENILLGLLCSHVGKYYLDVLNPTLNFQVENILSLPIALKSFDSNINSIVDLLISISKVEWDSRETSWDFTQNQLVKHQSQDLEETYDLFKQYWHNKFFQLHKNEEELNRQFIEIYDLQEELIPDVPLEDITILKEETSIENGQLVFKATEVFAQFMSYAVGCMFGRYSLDKEGLILANQGETLEDYLAKVEKSKNELSFTPDDDNIIPVLDDEWFEDDITGRFYAFLKASFGTVNFDKNLAFVEECLGKDVRKYFVRDFYIDNIKRYKKRPIYWMFSSPKGSFNVLIYMHRYTPDTLNKILNGYLIQYREKLNTRMEHLDHLIVSGSSTEQTKAQKEKDKLKLVLIELQEYERETLRPLAIERINIDLDEGVLVNYNKFGKAIKEVSGLNDKATKKKVLEFDWIDKKEIR
jgi:type II restriction/modification system DNA methylase subunit YeeA